MDGSDTNKMQKIPLLSKFKGSMVGAVVGDCIGSFFENLPTVSVPELLKFIKEKIEKNRKKPASFTDDTAMARSVAESLITNKGLNLKHMAKRFVEEFYDEPDRGYGPSVHTVFSGLKAENYENPHGPASRQFDGSGSYGNGGGMRIGPAALFGYNMAAKDLDDLVSDITKITHTHHEGIRGAILQSAAVHMALRLPWQPGQDADVDTWLDNLHERMKSHEASEKLTRQGERECEPYCSKLNCIKDYLKEAQNGKDPTPDEVAEKIGVGVSAVEACPAAVYSFARSTTTIPDIPSDNPFERTIIHAISLGGDTDTVATMAGAMAGACYGIDAIPQSWQNSCEGVQQALDFAESLYSLLEDLEK